MTRQLVFLSCCLLLLPSAAHAGSFQFSQFGPAPPSSSPVGTGLQIPGLSEHGWPTSDLLSIFAGPRRPVKLMAADMFDALSICPDVQEILSGHETEIRLWLTVRLWSGQSPSQWTLPPVLLQAIDKAIECKAEQFTPPTPLGVDGVEVPVPSSLAMLAATALTVVGGARVARRRRISGSH